MAGKSAKRGDAAPADAGAAGPDGRGPFRAVSRRLALVAALLLAALPAPSAAAADLGDPPGTWWRDAMGIDEAHALSTGEGVTVAVIDSVVDLTVPELADANVVPAFNACAADPVGEGLGSGYGSHHGTSMVSMVSQAAPDATVRAYAYTDTADAEEPCAGQGSSRSMLINVRAAFEQAVADGVDIISFSATLGGTLADLLEAAVDADTVVVVSVGNGPSVGLPALHSTDIGVVSVTGVGPDGRLGDYVVPGRQVVIAAPGTSLRTGGFVDGRWRSDGLTNGSSAATALTAGGLALVRSRYPEATGNQIVQHLIRHTTRDTLAFDESFGFGFINVPEMLENDPTRWEDVNPLTAVSRLAMMAEEYPDEAALATAATPDSGVTTSETAGPTASETAAPTASGPAPADDGSSEATGAGAASAGLGTWGVVAVTAAVVASALVLVLRSRRLRRSEHPDRDGSPPARRTSGS